MNHSQLYSRFENRLGFMRPYQKKRDKERSEGREKNLFKYFYNSLLPESTYLPLIMDISQSTPTYLLKLLLVYFFLYIDLPTNILDIFSATFLLY